MFGDFFLVEREGADAARGERLAFGETNGRNEAWLRDMLFDNPGLLPVKEIDPAYGPLIPLCTELRTEAGPLDIAFINQFGRLTLVECKLWRNPQARREVVAQVLHYAQAVSRWSYSDLQRQVSMATGLTGNVPYDLAKSKHPELVEHDFVDATAAALRAGRFLLLIAGDGIREDVGAMAELINSNAALGFSFGVVEVALYGFEDGALAIQPRVVTKTRIIDRSVVLVGDGSGRQVDVTSDIPEPVPTSDRSARAGTQEGEKQAEYRAWWSPVLAMTFDDPDQEPPKLYWPNNVRVQLPWPKVWLLAVTLSTSKRCGVWLVEGGQDKSLLPLLEERKEEIVGELPAGATATYTAEGVLSFAIERPWSSFANEEDKKVWLAEMLNSFVNVFRPLIKDLTADG